MMEWFPALRRLSVPSRRMLVDRLDGHPRAVEFANDLIQDALSRWGRRYGEWRLPDRPTPEEVAKEWNQLVEPALPKVERSSTMTCCSTRSGIMSSTTALAACSTG